jgi:hypothetical protein
VTAQDSLRTNAKLTSDISVPTALPRCDARVDG